MTRFAKGVIIAFAAVGIFATAVLPAFAVDPTASEVVSAGATQLKTDLLAVAQTILPYVATIAAVMIGWRFARRFFGR